MIGAGGKLYVSVGSSCNSCIEKENVRAAILEMNPDGSVRKIYASGLRNSVGMLWLGNYLFVTNQGADHLGDDAPDETFYAVRRGTDYSWARCYQSNGKIYRDKTVKPNKGCRGVPTSYAFFPAHSSAMGFDYFDSDTSDEFIRDSFLVALHGSTDKTIKHGYKIVIMRKDKS